MNKMKTYLSDPELADLNANHDPTATIPPDTSNKAPQFISVDFNSESEFTRIPTSCNM